MLLAVTSDPHANLQAWTAVLLDIRSRKADRIICLGDLVGYGPNPAEVLQSAHANVDHFVLGNHDAVIAGKLDESLFNERARQVIGWTRGRLGPNAVRFLGSLPLALDAGHFRCAHGDFSQPAAFNYVIDAEDAVPSWNAVPHQLLFAGHSHCPCIFVLGASGTPHRIESQDFEMEAGKRYLVNVGSVGQPRDGGTLASYCLYDTVAGSVVWRHLPFDIDAYRLALEAAGLSAEGSDFLTHDPRAGRPPVREMLNFSPAQTPEQEARGVVEVEALHALRRRVAAWKTLTWAAVGIAAIGFAVAGGVWLRERNRARVLDGGASVPVSAVTSPSLANVIQTPDAPVPEGEAVPGWRLLLGDGRRQQVGFGPVGDDGALGFHLRSATRKDELRIVSAPVRVRPEMKLVMESLFRKGETFAGSVALVVSVGREVDGRSEWVDQFLVKEPNEVRQGGWFLARQTFTCPAGASQVLLQIRGRFTGVVEVRDVRLCRKDPATE